MSLADCAQTQDEATAILRRASLIGMSDDARVEQGRRLERVFAEKIRTDKAALRLVQFGMRCQRVFHVRGTGFEYIDQIPVTAFKIIEHIAQLLCGGFGIEPKHPANDIIGSNFIGGVEVSWFRCRFERSDENPCRVRAQMQALAIHESKLGQRGSLALLEVGSRD